MQTSPQKLDPATRKYLAHIARERPLSIQAIGDRAHLARALRTQWPRVEPGEEKPVLALWQRIEDFIEPVLKSAGPGANVRLVVNVSKQPLVASPKPDALAVVAALNGANGAVQHRVTASHEIPAGPAIDKIPFGLTISCQAVAAEVEKQAVEQIVGGNPYHFSNIELNDRAQLHAQHNEEITAPPLPVAPLPRRPDAGVSHASQEKADAEVLEINKVEAELAAVHAREAEIREDSRESPEIAALRDDIRLLAGYVSEGAGPVAERERAEADIKAGEELLAETSMDNAPMDNLPIAEAEIMKERSPIADVSPESGFFSQNETPRAVKEPARAEHITSSHPFATIHQFHEINAAMPAVALSAGKAAKPSPRPAARNRPVARKFAAPPKARAAKAANRSQPKPAVRAQRAKPPNLARKRQPAIPQPTLPEPEPE